MSDDVTPVLEKRIDIDAPPERVWPIIADLKRMGEWSPQCRKMFVFGDIRPGTRTLNVNRKGLAVWPTSAHLIEVVANERIAFQVMPNRAVWSYVLEPTADGGTQVIERREVPDGVAGFAQFFAKVFLGGNAGLESDLLAGMDATLARIKTEVERQPA